MQNSTITLSLTLGNMSGYDHQRNTLFHLDQITTDKIHEAISLSIQDCITLFNATSAFYFMSRVVGLKNINTDNLKNVYSGLLKKVLLESPLDKGAIKQVIRLVNQAFRSKLDRLITGDVLLPTYPISGSPTICIPGKAIKLITTRNKVFFCCNLFNQSWADQNRLPSSIAFEINIVPMDNISLLQLHNMLNFGIKKDCAYIEVSNNGNRPVCTVVMVAHSKTPVYPIASLNDGGVGFLATVSSLPKG